MNKYYVIHVDKLVLTLDSNSINFNHPLFYLELSKETTPNYKDKYYIKYLGESLGYIDYRYTLNKYSDNSVLHFYNSFLYRPSFQITLNQLLACLKLNVLELKNLEIAIDTNYHLIKRFNHLITSGTFISQPHYDAYYYGKEFVRLKHGKNKETKYVTTSRKKKASVYQRIENKTEELRESGKSYIMDYLANSKIDVTKDIYRFELLITADGLVRYKRDLFQNIKTQEIITKNKYDKLARYLQFEYIDCVQKIQTNIDLARLNEPAYLNSLFNKFSKFRHEKMIETHHEIIVLEQDSTTLKQINADMIANKVSDLHFIYQKEYAMNNRRETLLSELDSINSQITNLQKCRNELIPPTRLPTDDLFE